MKKLFEKMNWSVVFSLLLFCMGCVLLSTVNEPTYDELMKPFPFVGMIFCITGILFSYIISLFD